MKEKESHTKSTTFKVKRRQTIDYDYIDHETALHDSPQEEEGDEFEYLQSLSESPGSLEVEECEDIEEEEEVVESSSRLPCELTDESLKARGNKNKHYVKPEEFEVLIKQYYSHGTLTNDLCDCVYKIANRLSYRPNFLNYSYREEMVGDAIERMIFALSNKIYKYNPNKVGKNGKKGNAFLYFTKIAENAFINRIKIETKNKETIDRYQEDVYYNLLQKGIDTSNTSKKYTE